ncbi:YdeI/OmpD-associated family protein [Leptospira sp. 96542]|nr:YdeI/OmpD-associated family protein [Leptospira sp. 96542]
MHTPRMPIDPSADPPTLFKSDQAFETWLKRHHATSAGIWLQIAKRGAEATSVTYPEAVEIALCWGWIDSQKKALDAHYFLQRFTPRRPRSVWSKVNVEKVEALIQAGRLQAPGLAQVESAKADGRWARAYGGASMSLVPEDLIAAFDAVPAAKVFFSTINAANRYAILWRIQTAVKPETRARRIAQLVAMLARGETIHEVKPKAKFEVKSKGGAKGDANSSAQG